MENFNVHAFGSDPKIRKAIQVAENISVSKSPVLIVGEIGIGKKTLAGYIHDKSSRGGAPINFVDCSAEADEVENQILGHRDAETGKFNKGILERSNNGTVVLTNVDGLDDLFQKKLHKILGELADYDLDIRIVSTTTKNLSKLVGSGRFYRGLYTYLSSNTINLTPLRERIHDIEEIAQHFIEELSGPERKYSLSQNALEKLTSHYWTHNLQELRVVIESSVSNCDGEMIDETDIAIGDKKTVDLMNDDDNEGIRLMSLKEAEKLLIKKALIHTSENRTQAAKILGVSIRTLRNKINEYRSIGNPFFLNLR